MKIDDRTGWFEKDGEWYLCHNGREIASFCLTEHSDPIKIMYSCDLVGEYSGSIEHPSGDLNEAKSIIENMVISYCSEQVDRWMNVRYSVIRTAGERVNNNG